jgi:hypothetical protein
MIRIESNMSLEILQSILGTTVSYGIRGRRATLKNNDLTICNNETLNIVIVDDNPPGRFCRVPAASFGGFNFTHDSVNELVVHTRYGKVHYRSKNGSCIPLASLRLPDHLTKLLQTANWGNRCRSPRITIGSLFNKDHSTYEVVLVTANQVQAVPFFGNRDQTVHFDNVAEVEAAIALKVGVKESEEEAIDEEEQD